MFSSKIKKEKEVKKIKNEKEAQIKIVDHTDYLGQRIWSWDYCKTHTMEDVSIGVASKQASRPSQEDFLAVGLTEVKGMNQLSFEKQELVLKETFKQMEKKSHVSTPGSTCCAAITWVDEATNELHVVTANLGDSATYLVILDNDNKVVKSDLLTKAHKPEDPEEKARIQKSSNGWVSFIGRDSHGHPHYNLIHTVREDGLAMSRAFGDTKFQSCGLIHDPTIENTTIKLLPTQKAFVIVASDGIDPLAKEIGPHTLGEVLSNHADKDIAEMTAAIIKKSLETLDVDNNSVGIIKPSATVASVVVFDGHSGDRISRELSEVFYPLLEKNIQLELAKQKNDEASPDSTDEPPLKKHKP